MLIRCFTVTICFVGHIAIKNCKKRFKNYVIFSQQYFSGQCKFNRLLKTFYSCKAVEDKHDTM